MWFNINIMKTESDVLEVVESLIEEAFPDLRGWRVHIKIVRTESFIATMMVQRVVKRVRIRVSRDDIEAMSESSIRGALAHELCHAEFAISTPMIRDLIRSIAQNFSGRARTTDERATDLCVISKGYGSDLMAFQKYHDKVYEAYGPEDGLTLDEIKRIVINGEKPTPL